MRKKYLIFMYQGPLDNWSLVTYSDLASATVYDDEGTDDLETAKKLWELVADDSNGEPLVLVEVIRDNEIEQEYK